MCLSRLWARSLLSSVCVAPLAAAQRIIGETYRFCVSEGPETQPVTNDYSFPVPVSFQRLPPSPNKINLTRIIPPPEFRVHTMADASGGVSLRTFDRERCVYVYMRRGSFTELRYFLSDFNFASTATIPSAKGLGA